MNSSRTECRLALIALASLVSLLPAAAVAGRSCEEKRPTVQAVTRGLELAARTQTELEASGARVVVLARAGQDLTRYGLHYSHLGFAYRTVQGDGTVAWRVVHKLNECGTAESAIYRQGLGDFFLDDPWRFEAAWAVLAPELQAMLLPVLQDDARAVALQHRPYSIVSYAWSQRYQQSNQWAIETLAAAAEPDVRPDRGRAQSWLAAHAYRPSVLTIGPLTRLGGRLTAANVAFDDHPPEKRFADRIETVTVDSVFDWLQRAQLGGEPVSLRLD